MKRITLDLPQELLDHIDDAATQSYLSRAEYMRAALQAAVQKHTIEISRIDRYNRWQWLDTNDS